MVLSELARGLRFILFSNGQPTMLEHNEALPFGKGKKMYQKKPTSYKQSQFKIR